jgi:hypothetical protein
MPFGDTFFRAIFLAISAADPVNVPGGGAVESVVTSRTHFRFVARFFANGFYSLVRLGVLEIEAVPVGSLRESTDGLTEGERRKPHPINVALANLEPRRLPEMTHSLHGESQ